MPAVIEPTAGRAVLYHRAPGDPFRQDAGDAGKPFPAVIRWVTGPALVDLSVCAADGVWYDRDRVPLVGPGDAPPSGGGWCEWVPAQVAKAQGRGPQWVAAALKRQGRKAT